VLTLGIDASAYATHLVELARAFSHHRRTWSPAPAIARPSSLERRVRAMLNARATRVPMSRPVSLAVSAALLAVAVAAAGFSVSAQTFSTVSGSVIDPQGALLPGVRIVLTNTQTDARYEVRTSRTGQFEFVGIPDGSFTLAAAQPGFQTYEERLTVAGRNLQRSVALKLGTLEETITVTASPGGPGSNQGYDVEAARARFREAAAQCSASSANAGAAVGGKIRPPRKIRHVAPVYPEGLKAAGIGGTVNLKAVIDADGRVRQVDPIPSQTVDPGLVAAASDAVQQWEFDGTLLNCIPVEVQMDVAVLFNPRQ
jgi:TonB family protein